MIRLNGSLMKKKLDQTLEMIRSTQDTEAKEVKEVANEQRKSS